MFFFIDKKIIDDLDGTIGFLISLKRFALSMKDMAIGASFWVH